MEISSQALEKVMTYLSTETLIYKCRFVSKEWNLIASGTCRQRYLHFKFPTQEELHKFQKIFQKIQSPPWSSYSFIRSGISIFMDYTQDIPVLLKFVSNFGNFILKIEIEGYNHQFLFDILEWTPNLQEIRFNGIVTKNEKLELSEILGKKSEQVERNLSKLKILQNFEINGFTSFQVFEFLVTGSRVLELVSLTLNPGGNKFATQISTLIAKISRLSLNMQHSLPQVWVPFSNQKLCVQELQFVATPPAIDKKEFYAPLEQFLHNVSPFLQKLVILHERSTEEGFTNFDKNLTMKIPNLPVLRNLEFIDGPFGGGTNSSAPFLFIRSPFKSNQFPSLQKIRLQSVGGTFEQFKNVSFESVHELEVNTPRCASHFLQNNWAQIFPRLRKLTCYLNENGLYYIFREMRHLEVLNMKINLKIYEVESDSFVLPKDSDINSILCGYEDPDTMFQALKQNITPSGELPTLCLKQLKNLKILTMDLADCSPLRDSGIFLTLLQMQPLLNLVLQNAGVSENSQKLLRNYHKSFQCLHNKRSDTM